VFRELYKGKGYGVRWLEDWNRTPRKLFQKASVIWKAVILSFPLIRNWLLWKVGMVGG
jgi:hypothetical protein